MVERIAAVVCIASVVIGSVLAFTLIWGPQSARFYNLFASCLVVFIASASIFSICTTLRGRPQSGR